MAGVAILILPLCLFAATTPEVKGQIVVGCSSTDTSPAAVEACVNAVRADPMRWQSEVNCDLSIYQPVAPLTTDRSLTTAAQIHADDMAYRYHDTNHEGFPQRLRDAGYGGNRVSENVAWWWGGAKDVVMGWMCSSGHARNIMDCGIQHFGTGVTCPPNDNCYYCQTFGGNGRC